MSCTVVPFARKPLASGVGVEKVPRLVRKLASSLMRTMQIQDGVGVVYVIGKGDEYSNQRAVETWLMTHYRDEQLQSISEPLKTLSKALKRHINNHYNNLEVYSC